MPENKGYDDRTLSLQKKIFEKEGDKIQAQLKDGLLMVFLPQLSQGKVRRSYLGVMIQGLTPEIGEKLNPGMDTGALVSGIVANGPASKIGIQRWDVIVAFGGKSVLYSYDLPQLVAATPIGRKTTRWSAAGSCSAGSDTRGGPAI